MKRSTGKGKMPLTKLGHTSGNQFGQNPDARSTKRRKPTERSA